MASIFKSIIKIGSTDAAKIAATDAAKIAATDATKIAVTDATKIAAADAAKVVSKDAIEGVVKSVVVDEVKIGAAQAAKNFITRNAGKLIAGVAVTTLATAALVSYNQLNNKSFNVTKITISSSFFSSLSTITVVYNSAGDKFMVGDTFILSNTDSSPSTDGKYTITSSSISGSTGTVTATTNMSSLSKDGSSGIITYNTTFGAQLGSIIGQTTGTVAGGITTGISPVVDGVFDSLGLNQYQTPILIFIALLVFLFIWINVVNPMLKISGVLGGDCGCKDHDFNY